MPGVRELRTIPSDINAIAVARTNIPELDKRYEGYAPQVRRAAKPKVPELDNSLPDRQIRAPDTLHGRTKNHAEEDLLNQVDADIRAQNLTETDLEGAVVDMHVSQSVCPNCRQGFRPGRGGKTADSGVVKQFSERNPSVTLNITNSNTTEVLVVKGGKRLD